MYVVRETMQCKPGKVKAMVEKFKGVSAIMKEMGFAGFSVATDVAGAPFWTVVAETEAESVDAFFAMEAKIMSNAKAGEIMTGYHDLVEHGRREIFKRVS